MNWDLISQLLFLLLFMTVGIFLGAWIAVRGFEKSLVKFLNDPEAQWNKDKETET